MIPIPVAGAGSKLNCAREERETKMSKIRIVVADDHTIVREGVRLLLDAQADMEVVGEAADGQQAVSQVRKLKPDIALVDIAMPNLNGLEATRAIKQECPQTHVIVLTMYESDE